MEECGWRLSGRRADPGVSRGSSSKVNDSFGFGQKHVAGARRALKGPGYAYKAG
jgi:hypothetical protein